MEILNAFDTSVRRALKEIDPKWQTYNGLIICGTHSDVNVDIMVEKIQKARESGAPYLGICSGYQIAAIEHARNVLGIEDATSEEYSDTGTFVVKKLPELNVGWRGGETFWNNYEVAIDYEPPENFFVTQSHPEYQSTKDKPHPLLVNFLNYARTHTM